MHNIKRIGLPLFAVVLLTLAIVGCVQPNPQYNPANPVSTSNPAFVPDLSSLSNGLATAHQVNNSVPTPYQAPINTALDGVLSLATLASIGVAWWRNNAAKRHALAATSLAQTIKAGGLAPKALDNAASPAVAATIAEHLQNT